MSTRAGALNVALDRMATRILPWLLGLMTAAGLWKSSSRSSSDGRMSIVTVIGPPVGGGTTGGGVTGGGVGGGGGGGGGGAGGGGRGGGEQGLPGDAAGRS